MHIGLRLAKFYSILEPYYLRQVADKSNVVKNAEGFNNFCKDVSEREERTHAKAREENSASAMEIANSVFSLKDKMRGRSLRVTMYLDRMLAFLSVLY